MHVMAQRFKPRRGEDDAKLTAVLGAQYPEYQVVPLQFGQNARQRLWLQARGGGEFACRHFTCSIPPEPVR